MFGQGVRVAVALVLRQDGECIVDPALNRMTWSPIAEEEGQRTGDVEAILVSIVCGRIAARITAYRRVKKTIFIGSSEDSSKSYTG